MIIINAIFFLGVLIGDVCYLEVGGLLIKSLTSAGFVLLGVINLIYVIKSKKYNRWFCFIMMAGLIFGMLGDILLQIDFIIGAIIFAVGHVIYFVAYCVLEKFRLTDLFSGLAIFIPSALFIALAPIFNFGDSTLQILCIVYAFFISFMLGKSVSNFCRKRSVLNFILLLGSFLFFFSDLMLLLDIFTSISNIAILLCLYSYYPAQCLLAFSLLFAKKENKKNVVFFNINKVY